MVLSLSSVLYPTKECILILYIWLIYFSYLNKFSKVVIDMINIQGLILQHVRWRYDLPDTQIYSIHVTISQEVLKIDSSQKVTLFS